MEYEFLGKRVYAFNPGSCQDEGLTEVVDEKANFLCVIGGNSGKLKCDGVVFTDFAEQVDLIWSN